MKFKFIHKISVILEKFLVFFVFLTSPEAGHILTGSCANFLQL